MEVSKELASSLEVGDGGYGVVDDGLRSSLEVAVDDFDDFESFTLNSHRSAHFRSETGLVPRRARTSQS
jgi:hypothetical protein